MFTKQHINVFVAEIINTHNEFTKATHYAFIRDLLVRHCPRFDSDKFRQACYPNTK